MKELDELLMLNNIFQWNDSDVLDFELEPSEDHLLSQLLSTECPKCGEIILLRSNKLIPLTKSSPITGTHLVCHNCKQPWYVHKPIKVPSDVELMEGDFI